MPQRDKSENEEEIEETARFGKDGRSRPTIAVVVACTSSGASITTAT